MIGLVPVATAYATTHYVGGPNPDAIPETAPPADGIAVLSIDGLGPSQTAADASNGSLLYQHRTDGFHHDGRPGHAGADGSDPGAKFTCRRGSHAGP
ncbi:MAG: hypothetical protein ACOCS7_02330 [Halolamina sp.]